MALSAAASEVETRLRSGGVDIIDPLSVVFPAQNRPSARAIAVYCAAAGEAARVDASGSAAQAVRLLTRALASADAASDAGLAALSAYRLGMAALASAGWSSGSRSAEGPAPIALGAEAAAGSAACTAVLAPTGAGSSRGPVSPDRAFECSADRALASGTPALAARARLRLARLRLEATDTLPALASMLRQLSASTALAGLDAALMAPAGPQRAMLLGRLSETALDAGAGANPTIVRAIAAMREGASNDRAIAANAAAIEARVAMARNDPLGAAAGLRRAIFLESQSTAPLRLPDWYMLLAEVEPENRDRHVAAAYAALEAVRPLLPLRDLLTEESTFSLHMSAVFQAALDQELRLARSADGVLHIQAAQRVLETYRQAEIESVFGNDCVPPREPIAARLAASARSERADPRYLSANEIVLYPVLLRDRVELIYASGRDGGGYQLAPAANSIGRSEMAALVEEMRASLAGSARGQDWSRASRRLYEVLIQPIEGQFNPDCATSAEACTTLIIVPDGPLRALAFAALRDWTAGAGSYLIQKTRLAIAPALAYAQPGQVAAGRDASVVSAWVDSDVTLSAGVFRQLAAARSEAYAAADLPGVPEEAGHGPCMPSGALLCNFSARDLSEALSTGRVDVLHLATHASFEGRTDRSFIVANNEAIPLVQLRRMIARNRLRADELDLLVLSACETARGDDQASMGLAGAAVQAGARSALASLWQVNDSSTSELMRLFYQHYRTGEAKAEALRAAQLALIAGGEYDHPHHWAAFMLIGGWR